MHTSFAFSALSFALAFSLNNACALSPSCAFATALVPTALPLTFLAAFCLSLLAFAFALACAFTPVMAPPVTFVAC